MRRKVHKKFKLKDHKFKITILAALLCALFVSFFFAEKIEEALGLGSDFALHQTTYSELAASDYLVEYIDVGQGNCTFIILPDGKTILIDGGNTEYGKTVADFISEKGISQIDYLIATHADADHIGGLNYVLENLEIKNIFRPFQISGTGTNASEFVSNEYEDLADVYIYLQEATNNRSKISRVTSTVYSNFIENIYTETYTDNGEIMSATITVFYDGLKITGENYEIEFYAPFVRSENIDLSEYSSRTNGYATMGYGTTDSNNCSSIFTVTIYDEIFLFTGDASYTESLEDEEVTSGYLEIDFVNSLTSDEILKLSGVSVYLAGHHGSKYSSGETLLSLICPKFCVVSVGENNSYGHPTAEALEIMNKYKTSSDDILLTSTCGNISFGSVSGTLVYVLENETEAQKITISWYLLGTIIFIVASVLIISAKSPKNAKKKG